MTSSNYTQTAKWLHWLIAVAIVLQYVLAELAEIAGDEGSPIRQLAYLANHKSVGLTILLAALIRIFWRWRYPPPALPNMMSKTTLWAARLTHWAFYLCLLALPVSGWLLSSASAYTVSWFNLFALPDLVAADEALKTYLGNVHEWLAEALIVLAVVHVAAAIKHALWDKDDVLARMMSWPALLSAAAGFILALVVFSPGESAPPVAEKNVSVAENTEPTDSTHATALPGAVAASSINPWVIDYASSFIEFSGEQAGAPFTGRWLDWRAEVRFDPAALEESSAEVVIQAEGVDSNDGERDDTIRGAQFFDVANFATISYVATTFEALEDGFVAHGHLQIKALTLPMDLHFTVVEEQGKYRLDGTASIDRLAFSVGTGEWQDVTWVGQHVDVRVRVTAEIETGLSK